MAQDLALNAWDPIWPRVLISAAPLPILLPVCGLGKQLRMAQSLRTLHPLGDLEELLASDFGSTQLKLLRSLGE